MANVLNQPSSTQLIWDVRLGIGTDKFALNAHQNGPSTHKEFAFQFLTNASNGMPQEPAHHATKDTN